VQATVTGVNRGDTTFAVNVPGQSQTTPVTVNIRVVPGIGFIAMLVLTILIGVVGFRRLGTRASR
jgi:hypothetical protein